MKFTLTLLTALLLAPLASLQADEAKPSAAPRGDAAWLRQKGTLIFQDNLAIECKTGTRIDARGVSRGYDKNPTLLKIMAAMKPTEPPWRDRFPTLPAISESLPPLPVGCIIERNVAIGCEKPLDLHGSAKDFTVVTVRDNAALPLENLGFADPAKLDFRMSPDAAVFKKVPGFESIPFEKIGLYTNELRPTLPQHPAGNSRPSWGKP